MPSERASLALFDIRDHIRRAENFISGLSEAEFVADEKTVYAVVRCLEIISEAARRLPSDVRDRHPQLPWRAIMGAGNIYRHDYDNVSETFVWRTVRHDLASLFEAVEREIAQLPPADAE